MSQKSTEIEGKDTIISSRYSPLNPKGPLPPGVTARVVRNAYKTIPIRPRLVLSLAKIPIKLSSPNVTLREALDSPDVRDRLEKLNYKNKSLAFHQLLYDATIISKVGRGLNKRLINPSIDIDEQGLSFLNTTRFNVSLITEMGGFDTNIDNLEPGSTEEALALFALAFALLQPKDADKIIRPVLELGYGFITFFGVAGETYPINYDEYQAPDKEEDILLPLETSIIERIETQTPPKAISSVTSSNDAIPATKSTYRTDKETKLTEDVDEPIFELNEDKYIEIDGEPDIVCTEIGKREAEYREAQARLENARKKRIYLGTVSELDSKAIMKAMELEETSVKSLHNLETMLIDETKQSTSKATSLLDRYVNGVEFEKPPEQEGNKIAIWLDRWTSRMANIEELLKDLDRKEALLKTLLPDKRIEPKKASLPTTLEEIHRLMEELNSEIDKAINEALDWNGEVEKLRSLLMDCIKPVRSSSLLKVKAKSVYALIHLACYDQRFEALLPLLFRFLGEIEDLQDEDQKRFCIFIEETLQLTAMHRNDELYQEITSFLPISMLQNLLRRGTNVLARHLILSTFQQSIVRQDPIFFNEIWSCSGWFERQESVGGRLSRIFDALNRVYMQQGSIHAVVSVLKDSEKKWETDEVNESQRYQESEDLSTRLESPSGMTGNFGRVRWLATNMFFKPIANKVRQRRYHDVNVAILELEQDLRKGEMEKKIFQQLGELAERSLRTDHKESLKRYLESHLSAIREWLEKEKQVKTKDILVKESYTEEDARKLVNKFMDEKASSQISQEVGTVNWIESYVRQLINTIRSREIPEAPFAFFGILPSIENLFSDKGSSPTAAIADIIKAKVADGESLNEFSYYDWHIDMARSPILGRLWLCYLEGSYSWKDILQEGIAVLLLNNIPSSIEGLNSFLEYGRPEAVLEAERLYDYQEVDGITEVVQKAKDLKRKKEKISQQLNEMSHKLNVFPRVELKVKDNLKLDEIELNLLMAMDLLDSFQLEKAEQIVNKLKLCSRRKNEEN